MTLSDAARLKLLEPPVGKVRVVLDTDTYNEIDDQFAIVYAMLATERINLQIGADFFNIFNHPNFSNPNLPNFITDPANNGLDATGRGIGFLPLTATGDVGIGNPFLGGGGPRGVQFSAKITF